MGEKMYLKVKESYINQFITTIKGNIFYKDKVTEYNNDDGEVDNLLSQGLLVIVEDSKEMDIVDGSKKVKNDMDATNEEYKNMLKEDKKKAKEEVLKQFETEEVEQPEEVKTFEKVKEKTKEKPDDKKD